MKEKERLNLFKENDIKIKENIHFKKQFIKNIISFLYVFHLFFLFFSKLNHIKLSSFPLNEITLNKVLFLTCFDIRHICISQLYSNQLV